MDDIPESKFLNPPLSSINSNIDKVCKLAVQSLIDKLMGKPYEKNTVIESKLFLRKSTEID